MKSESGNVIWFLLLAIALLAALAITITRSSDIAGQNGDVEMTRVQASAILKDAKGVEQAVDRMSMQGVSVGDISFGSSGLSGYANASCADDSCYLYKVAGGGQTYAAPSEAWLDSAQSARPFYGEYLFTGKTCVQGVGNQTEDIATDCSTDGDPANEDLVLLLPYVTESLCMELNTLAGVSNPSGAPPVDTGDVWAASPQFTGVFADGASIGTGNAVLYGKRAGCVEGAGTPPAGAYVFYYVLMAR